MRTPWTWFCALLPFFLASPGWAEETEIKVEHDIVYGKGGDTDLQLDLARPVGEGPFPAVVCIHGGGWQAGKRQDLDGLTKMLARRGFVAATITYRLAPKHRFPSQIEDCKAAVRWVRANAKKYRIDGARIGTVGFSAGAHLACLLGVSDPGAKLEGEGGNPGESSRVQAVVSFFGPTDFTVRTWEKTVEDSILVPFLGGSLEDKKDLYRLCSPLLFVTKDAPPFLFFHGAKDRLVGIYNSEKMVKKCKEVGVPAELVTLPDAGHGWGGADLERTLERTARFLKEKLDKK